MRNLALLAGAALLAPAAAFACPTITSGATQITVSEAQLLDPYWISTRAGGDIALGNCGYAGGYVTATPQMSVNFTDTAGPVQVSTSSTCDTVLLVNAPDGSWWFDDDSGGNLQAWMMVDVNPGRMDIWVGTYGGPACDASVILN